AAFFGAKNSKKATITFLKILILLALVMEEREIALAALGVLVTLNQHSPPDNPENDTCQPSSPNKETLHQASAPKNPTTPQTEQPNC
ncbi:MAG: hypothetical protein PHH72_12660, partial [Parabacteroides sp.]|nr:hypothetical protein [Parabacteroides sp.]